MSPFVVPVILVPKNNGSWRMCKYYRVLNNIISSIRTLFPSYMIYWVNYMVFVYFQKLTYHQI